MCIAFPGRVVAIEPSGALVETEGRLRRASTLLVEDLVIGDWVTVGAGTILARLEPAEAARIREILGGQSGTTNPSPHSQKGPTDV
jgi:hydrogenase expression/formation protein HypC